MSTTETNPLSESAPTTGGLPAGSSLARGQAPQDLRPMTLTDWAYHVFALVVAPVGAGWIVADSRDIVMGLAAFALVAVASIYAVLGWNVDDDVCEKCLARDLEMEG